MKEKYCADKVYGNKEVSECDEQCKMCRRIERINKKRLKDRNKYK